jgi:hypothetical protein
VAGNGPDSKGRVVRRTAGLSTQGLLCEQAQPDKWIELPIHESTDASEIAVETLGGRGFAYQLLVPDSSNSSFNVGLGA